LDDKLQIQILEKEKAKAESNEKYEKVLKKFSNSMELVANLMKQKTHLEAALKEGIFCLKAD
jgi:uncharacterized membrane-anchored protein YhcB (DUF1043 family)